MARHSLAARRYAKSLHEIAKERNASADVAADMELISSTIEQSRDLRVVLRSPIIKTDKKLSILNAIFSGEIGSISLHFLGLIAKKKRENLLAGIAASYMELYREEQGIVSAEITTAVPLIPLGRKKAIEMIGKWGGKSVELEEKVDPSIIGGFLIRLGDQQYDDSISGRLQDMRRTLKKDIDITQKQNIQNG